MNKKESISSEEYNKNRGNRRRRNSKKEEKKKGILSKIFSSKKNNKKSNKLKETKERRSCKERLSGNRRKKLEENPLVSESIISEQVQNISIYENSELDLTNSKEEKKVGKDKNNNKKEKKKKSWFRKLLKVIGILLLILLILAGIALGYIWYHVEKNGGGVQGLVSTFTGVNMEESKNMPPIYTLIVGTNEDNTDTILIAGYSPRTQEVSLLSVPRDTFIGKNIKRGLAKDKINATYRLSGIDQLLKEVNTLTGLDIKNYVIVDTKGVIELVDAIGGVNFDVPIDMNYHDSSQNLSIEVKKGYQLLNGKNAEGVVRFRHNDNGTTYPYEYGIEDIGRNRTQREFFKAALKQTIQAKNITKMFELLDIYKKNVKTNLDMEYVKKYVPALTEFDPETIKSARIEGQDVNTTAWFFEVNAKKLKEQIFDLFVFSDNPEKIKKLEEEAKKEEEKKQKTSTTKTTTTTSKTNSTSTSSSTRSTTNSSSTR